LNRSDVVRSEDQTSEQTNSLSDLARYSNPGFGYSIDYPKDWTVSYVDRETRAIWNNDHTALILISVNNSVGQNTTLEDITDELVLSMPEGFKMDINNYTFLGYPALRIGFTENFPHTSMGETDVKSIGIITVINGKGYVIGALAPDSKFSVYAQIFEHMINSFDVKERL
jgi:hypothetical protein